MSSGRIQSLNGGMRKAEKLVSSVHDNNLSQRISHSKCLRVNSGIPFQPHMINSGLPGNLAKFILKGFTFKETAPTQ